MTGDLTNAGRAADNVRATGTVYLVGAGPGDPGLLTLRGAELLRAAEVVVYDRLAHPALLDLVPEGAERIYVGKAPGNVELNQDEINALLVNRAGAGCQVVRLKGGDPFVFGRGGEEAEVLQAAGLSFEVVPGISSAIAAAAYAGIPVTHRGLATHVTIVTGHEDPAKGSTDVDWEALARAGGTLVILMGVGNLGEITRRLMEGGRDPQTPVAAVRWGTRPNQRTVRSTLERIAKEGVESPSAIVVGEVAALDLSWFEHRPLFGRRIVVTRAREQVSELREQLEVLGAEVIELPSIQIEPLDFAVPDLTPYSWLVFTSPNGVQAFFERGIAPAGLDARALAGLRVAGIGPGTQRALAGWGITADLVPPRFVAESMVEAFPPPGSGIGPVHEAGSGVGGPTRVLIPRAAQARDVLPDGLRAKGYEVEVLPVYRTTQVAPDPIELARLRRGEADVLTFTSSSTVRNFHDAVGAIPDPQPLVICIGPVTADTARSLGYRVDAVAEEHTINGLVNTLLALGL